MMTLLICWQRFGQSVLVHDCAKSRDDVRQSRLHTTHKISQLKLSILLSLLPTLVQPAYAQNMWEFLQLCPLRYQRVPRQPRLPGSLADYHYNMSRAMMA